VDPLITVVIPCYNRAQTIGLCLRSVAAQTYPAIEVIVVDDASTDDSVAIAEAAGATVRRLGVNSGPAAARNLGAEHARGEILFFLDADVALEPGSVASAVAELRSAPDLGAICGVLGPESLRSQTLVAQYRALQMYHWWLAYEGPMTGLHTALCAMWARVFRELGPFDPDLRHTEAPEYGRRLSKRYRIRSTAAIAGVHDHDATLRTLLPKVFHRARASTVEWAGGDEVPSGALTRALGSVLVLLAALTLPLPLVAGTSAAALPPLLVAASLGLETGTYRRVIAARGFRIGLAFAAIHLLYQLTSAAGAAVGTAQRIAARRAALILLPVFTATALLLGSLWVRSAAGITTFPGGDLSVYREALRTMLDGGALYEFSQQGYPFVYPPFAALVLLPFAVPPLALAYWLWTLGSVLCVQASVWLLLGAIGVDVPDRRRHLVVGTAVVLPLSPVLGTLVLGNVNLALLLLILADLWWMRGRYRGLLIGVAAGIKLTPLIFVPYLLLTGRVRAGLTALTGFAGTIGLGFLLLPAESLAFWDGTFADSSRTTPPDEQTFGSSIRGVWVSLLPDAGNAGWLVLSALVAVAGTTVAVVAYRRGGELAGAVACGTTGLLVSPVTWYAHWVWCVPVLTLIAAPAVRGGRRSWALFGGLWLVFALPLPWWTVYRLGAVDVPMRDWVGPTELLYLLTGATLLALTVTRTREVAR
jgi:GT2 family glycosyltransferase